jgi:hypothetical protein
VHERLEGPGVQPRRAPVEHGDVQGAATQVLRIDRGDLELAPVTGLEVPRDLDDVVVVEVQTGDGVAALGLLRLLLDREHLAVGTELHDAVRRGVGHPVGEHPAAGDRAVGREGPPEPGAVEDVVAEHEGDGLVADEVRADDEGLGQPLGARLDGVLEGDAQVGAVTEEVPELRLVLRSRDHQDLADAGHHQRGERVVDHRLVVDRHDLLADAPGDRVEPGP